MGLAMVSSWMWLATALTTTLLYFVMKLINHRRFYRDLPKPPYSIFWGHLKLMGELMGMYPGAVHIQYAMTTMCYMFDLPGAFYVDLWPLGPRFLVIVDPDIALYTTVIKNHPKHGDIMAFIDPVVGSNNIVAANGPYWKYLHNMLAPAFAISRVRGMAGLIGDEVMKFRSTLKQFAESGEIFHMEHTTGQLTFDVIGTVVFGPGSSLSAQKDGGSAALTNFMDMMKYNCTERESKNPWTKFTSRQKRITATNELNATLTEQLRQRYNEIERDNVDVSQKRKLTIMDLILRERIEETRKAGGGTEAALSREFLDIALTQIKTMLLAGTGTTNDTITFTYMLLSKHPEVVQKLREEHSRVFAPTIDETHKMLQDPDHHAKINDLNYTENVIKETLRFFPIGSTARAADENGYFDYKGERYVTKGHMLLIVSHTMQMNPKYFPNAGKWDPDRFSRDESPRHAWRPFERGPRGCIGQTLAMDELKIILLLTVRDFDFHCSGLKPNATPRVPWTDMDLTFGDRAFQEFIFEARPRDGMPMTVTKAEKH